jgi:hypothetical protein
VCLNRIVTVIIVSHLRGAVQHCHRNARMIIDGIKAHPSVTIGRIIAAVEATRRSLENPGICISCGAQVNPKKKSGPSQEKIRPAPKSFAEVVGTNDSLGAEDGAGVVLKPGRQLLSFISMPRRFLSDLYQPSEGVTLF